MIHEVEMCAQREVKVPQDPKINQPCRENWWLILRKDIIPSFHCSECSTDPPAPFPLPEKNKKQKKNRRMNISS